MVSRRAGQLAREAVEWAAARVDLQLRLLHAIRTYWTFSGAELRDWLESALSRAGDLPPIVRARALAGVAEAAGEMGDFEGALAYHEEAVATYRSVGDDEGVARSLVGLGRDLEYLGRPTEAREMYEEGLRTARRAPSSPVIVGASASLALLSLEEGDFENAVRFAADVEEIDAWRGFARRVSGLVALKRDDSAKAARLLSESLAFYYELGYEPSVPFSLEALAAAFAACGDVERAAVLIGHSEALRDSLGFKPDRYSRGLREKVVEAAQRDLGDDAYRAATARGASLSVDEAVAYALASID